MKIHYMLFIKNFKKTDFYKGWRRIYYLTLIKRKPINIKNSRTKLSQDTEINFIMRMNGSAPKEDIIILIYMHLTA